MHSLPKITLQNEDLTPSYKNEVLNTHGYEISVNIFKMIKLASQIYTWLFKCIHTTPSHRELVVTSTQNHQINIFFTLSKYSIKFKKFKYH